MLFSHLRLDNESVILPWKKRVSGSEVPITRDEFWSRPAMPLRDYLAVFEATILPQYCHLLDLFRMTLIYSLCLFYLRSKTVFVGYALTTKVKA